MLSEIVNSWQLSKDLLGHSDPQVEEDTVHQNVCNCLPVYKEFTPEDLNIQVTSL
jgi:hypothetical protein